MVSMATEERKVTYLDWRRGKAGLDKGTSLLSCCAGDTLDNLSHPAVYMLDRHSSDQPMSLYKVSVPT
jgi:hypothetical protein